MSIPQIPPRIGRAAFLAAGALMLVQVFFIGLRRYGFETVSELWAAPPAIASIVASIVGLVALYPALATQSPRLSRAGVGAALVAGGVLCAAAAWLVGSAAFGGGVPQPLPPGLLGAIAVFMIAYVLGFGLNAAAGLRSATLRPIGCLLSVPVLSWAVILAVAMASNLSDALKLDFYTNVAIAFAFIAIGIRLKNMRPPEGGTPTGRSSA